MKEMPPQHHVGLIFGHGSSHCPVPSSIGVVRPRCGSAEGGRLIFIFCLSPGTWPEGILLASKGGGICIIFSAQQEAFSSEHLFYMHRPCKIHVS